MPAILRGVSERVDRSWRGAEGKEERREGDGSWYVIDRGGPVNGKKTTEGAEECKGRKGEELGRKGGMKA